MHTEPEDHKCGCGAKVQYLGAKLCRSCAYQARIEAAARAVAEAEYWREYAEIHEAGMRKRFNLDYYDQGQE